MIINLSPVFGAAPIHVAKVGDRLDINGETYDFSSLPDGADIDPDAVRAIPGGYFTGEIFRQDGRLSLTLVLPYASENPSLAVAFPSPIIDPPDGPLDLPFDPEPIIEEEADHVDA